MKLETPPRVSVTLVVFPMQKELSTEDAFTDAFYLRMSIKSTSSASTSEYESGWTKISTNMLKEVKRGRLRGWKVVAVFFCALKILIFLYISASVYSDSVFPQNPLYTIRQNLSVNSSLSFSSRVLPKCSFCSRQIKNLCPGTRLSTLFVI